MKIYSVVKHFFLLVKFSHTIFAMPFALSSFFWAWHESGINGFPWRVLLLVALCMVFARNAAMGFNRYIDREYDKKNQRTKNREIPAGIISANTALVFVMANSVAFCVTTIFINPLAFYLSFAALAVILVYSYTKRFTSLCHFVLGTALAIAPTGAYIAMTGRFAPFPILLSVLVFFWVSGFDILYALPDCEFDRENKLYSVPAVAGIKNAMILSILLHVITILMTILIGVLFDGRLFYWTGAIIFAGLLIYQHTVVTPTNLKRINAAFAVMNGTASVCYACFLIADMLIAN